MSVKLILTFFFVGTIEFEEYLSFMLSFIKKNLTTEDNLKDAFNLFDQNGDGFIDSTELREILTNLGEKITDEDIDEMIREADIGIYFFFYSKDRLSNTHIIHIF
jgi:Ca2+-binding EF-hand superfamily protein